MTGVEFLLFVILCTPRAASHGHDIAINRFSSEGQCISAGKNATSGDSRNHYVCAPVAPLPIDGT